MILALLAALTLQSYPAGEYAETLRSGSNEAYVEWYREGIVISLYPRDNPKACDRQYCTTLDTTYPAAQAGTVINDGTCRFHVQMYTFDDQREIRIRNVGSCPGDYTGYYSNPTGRTEPIEEGSGD